MPKVKVGDINIYYEVHGKGESLVLIMGLGGNTTRWFRIMPLLSQEHKVIAFDNRGAGRSDKPDIPYSMEMMADDIAGLLDAIGIDSAHIFGISLGGMIAQHFALRHPRKVTSLILGCTRCGGSHSIVDDSGSRNVLDPQRLWTMTPEERARDMLPALWSQEFIDHNPGIVEEHIALSIENPIDPTGYIRQLQAANIHDTYDRLPEIQTPTLIIAGDADRLIPVGNSVILSSRIPGSELVILPKMGHGFYTEARDETARIIMDFMKRNSRSYNSQD